MTRKIKPYYTQQDSLIFVDKISGMNTHSPEFGQLGCVEIIELEVEKKLYVVHRLDKGTSGALVFATSAELAASLTELFAQHQIDKRYIFLTDRQLAKTEYKQKSFIQKEKNVFVSQHNKEPNAETDFRFLKKLGSYYLWEARPLTGKPHQIRLHAEDLGMPLLGDTDHNGSAFPQLCLHSCSLEFTLKDKEYRFEAPLPFWAQEELSQDIEENTIKTAIERRQKLFDLSILTDESLRLCHREIDSYRIDQYGDTLWVYWYKESDPSESDMQRFKRLHTKTGKKIYIRKMLNRGEDPNAEILWPIGEPQSRWSASENGVKFELRTDSGLSPGVFLDQRENRHWIAQHAQDKRVLNLFSYTSGFSVVAALSGAQEICTVDVSANFIEWSKRNFEINGLNPEQENYEFWVQDCILFLKGTVRRKRKFNLIVCDPPSFGRSKSGVFSISKNFDELVINCLYCLEKNGLLLFSTNYEKWTTGDLHLRLNKLKKEFSFKVLDAPQQGLDFELPGQDSLMKSIIIRKN